MDWLIDLSQLFFVFVFFFFRGIERVFIRGKKPGRDCRLMQACKNDNTARKQGTRRDRVYKLFRLWTSALRCTCYFSQHRAESAGSEPEGADYRASLRSPSNRLSVFSQSAKGGNPERKFLMKRNTKMSFYSLELADTVSLSNCPLFSPFFSPPAFRTVGWLLVRVFRASVNAQMCVSVGYSSKWRTMITVNLTPWRTIKVHKNTLMSNREQGMNKFTPVGPGTLWPRPL